MELFASLPLRRKYLCPENSTEFNRNDCNLIPIDSLKPSVDEMVLDVYGKANDPTDPFELRNLWVGRVESALGKRSIRPELAEYWNRANTKRKVSVEEVLNARATVKFVKELFNFYFRDDLYGKLHADSNIILSSGAVNEELWGMSSVLKETLNYALSRDWYGYSDSRGRIAARDAIAKYENSKLPNAPYSDRNAAITMGATFAINCIAEMVLTNCSSSSPALCGIPNYPPLVESISRRNPTQLVSQGVIGNETELQSIIEQLKPDTPLVLIQTVTNPTGLRVNENELELLIKSASPSTVIILDESHEWLGPRETYAMTPLRAAANVVRVSSLSKCWSAPGMKVGWLVADERFIDSYYEYASSTFGGPPSFFYTMIEVLCRMEAWSLNNVENVGLSEVNEFESFYGLNADRLNLAYHYYLGEKKERLASLQYGRENSMKQLHSSNVRLFPPEYSINMILEITDSSDSYLCFRELLDKTGVSLFPGILNFYLSGGIMRATTAINPQFMHQAAKRILNEKDNPITFNGSVYL